MKKRQLEQVVKSLHSEAYLWSRQCCGFDNDLAQDVLQQVYLKILEGGAVYREESKVKTWLFSVIRYTALECIRKKPPTRSLQENFDMEDRSEEAEAISHEGLIQLLPAKQKEVLLLVFYHGLTLEKAATVMEVSLGTARTHYDRGKKKLKSLILKNYANENAER